MPPATRLMTAASLLMTVQGEIGQHDNYTPHGMSRRHDESPSVALAVAEKSDAGSAYADYAPADVTCV